MSDHVGSSLDNSRIFFIFTPRSVGPFLLYRMAVMFDGTKISRISLSSSFLSMIIYEFLGVVFKV